MAVSFLILDGIYHSKYQHKVEPKYKEPQLETWLFDRASVRHWQIPMITWQWLLGIDRFPYSFRSYTNRI